MRFLQTTYQSLIIILLVLSSCTDEVLTDTEIPAGPSLPPASRTFITLNIPVPTQTRSVGTPAGGEDGDDKVSGEKPEDKVNNITVYFYQKEDGETLNQAASRGRLILAATHFSALSPTSAGDSYTTETKEVELKDGTYQMLVVANNSDIQNRILQGDPLKDLCDFVQYGIPWKETDGSYSEFIMTSAEEQTVTLEAGKTEKDRPLTISGINLQRLAARIDFIPSKGKEYSIDNFTIRVDAIKIINRMVGGSYLLKQTATGINDAATYLGKETADANKRATNYVIDPWTSGKLPDKCTENKGLYQEHAEDAHMWTDEDRIQSPSTDKDYYTLGYALENTTSKDAQLCGYSTGVMIKATAIPQKVINETGKVEDNKEIIDFYVYREKVYKSPEAVKTATGIRQEDFSSKGVKVYKEGVTYYPYYIRHCYNGTTANAIMEFAIVRNNVYKLQVNSFSSLGNTGDTLGPETPSKETLVTIGATVRPWNELDEENIIM